MSNEVGMLPRSWRRPVLGVLGGMGPAATVAFLDALVRATPAATDQDHIDTVVLNHAGVPDRTAALKEGEAADPAPVLADDLELLARIGADVAVIACNTAHAFLPQELPLPVLSIIDCGAQRAATLARGARGKAEGRASVGVLATDGTVLSGLYQEALRVAGVDSRTPDAAGQAAVMEMVYDRVKAGVNVSDEEFLGLIETLRGDADVVLLGCTELSVLAEQAIAHGRMPAYVVDAQQELVRAVLGRFAS